MDSKFTKLCEGSYGKDFKIMNAFNPKHEELFIKKWVKELNKETFLNGTFSTEPQKQEPLTAEKIKDAIQILKNSMEDNPFQKLAKSKGFDLTKGDKMVFPKGFAEAHGITENASLGIMVSGHHDCSVLLIKSNLTKTE